MSRAVFAAIAAFLFSACASVPDRHPTPEHKIAGCYIACPFGYALRQQHICRSNRTQFKDILISGEDDNRDDPSESRWVTGATSIAVERIVLERLHAAGVVPSDKDWSKRFGDLFEEIRAEVGDDAAETYMKVDVVLQTCASVIQMRAAARDPSARGVHPGEQDPLHPEDHR